MLRSIVGFVAIVFTALALVPAGAHVAELPAKIAMSRDDYFTVQDIYRGWSLFGVVLIGALLSTLTLAVTMRRLRWARGFAAAAFLALAGSLAVFFFWTYPANQATANWTTVPETWESLRRQWEFSHAAAAGLDFVAFCACVLAVLIGLRSATPPD